MQSFYCFIPARLKSTRFPNKMLINIRGLPLISYVYKKCLKSKFFKNVVVATCDNEILKEIKKIKGKAIMTSHLHKGCISRIAEAVIKKKNIKIKDYICIVQGDEVLVEFKLLNSLCKFVRNNKKNCNVVNVVSKIKDNKEYKSKSVIKALIGENYNIINMLRTSITQNVKSFDKNISKKVFRQTGIIVIRKDFLIKYYNLKRSFFEIKESIDMLRFLENDIKIKSYVINKTMIGIDTKKDYLNFIKNY